ncbi:MAG: hypothetical protein IJM19_09105, partial [Ruminococcus sp.]|nr:hypothetical protein [Ruminococcus sp.]
MKTEKNRKLKGTVLLAVVATMALLIIFMGTTLILASAANNRAHKSYATSQAEYTAQAAIKAFTTALKDDQDASMIAAVEGLGGPAYPDVVINNSSIGRIGYYESDGSWVENKIKVEPLGESPDFVYGVKTFGSDPEWYKPNRYRITATARVGRDEKTVSLYMTSMPLDGEEAKSIEGFQTIGDSSFDATQDEFNGALVVGIKKDGTGTYGLNNQTKVNCNYVFINGDLNVPGQGQINVNTEKFKMTVTGSMKIQNDNFMNVNYTGSSNPEAKDIPYMYVDGKIDGEGSFVKIKGTKEPFNVFAGSANLPKFDMDANLYLMDSGVTNVLGQDGSKLYKWSSSVVNGTDQNLGGDGGSLFSMGSVKTGDNTVKFDGDVRIVENLIPTSKLEIGGNLIVGGNLIYTQDLSVGNGVYARTVITDREVPGVSPISVSPTPITDALRTQFGFASWFGGVLYINPSNPDELWASAWGGGAKNFYVFDTDTTGPVTVSGVTIKPLSAMMGDLGYDSTDIYPQSMTRESIYMHEDPVGSGNWVDTESVDNGGTRFIKTITDIQNAVGMNPTTGALPYPSAPTEGKAIDEYDSYTTGGDYYGPGDLNPAVSEGGAITKSCIIDHTVSGDLEIFAKDSDIWVILDDGVKLNEKTITVKNSPYTVKFFVAGYFQNFKGVIKNEKPNN